MSTKGSVALNKLDSSNNSVRTEVKNSKYDLLLGKK